MQENCNLVKLSELLPLFIVSDNFITYIKRYIVQLVAASLSLSFGEQLGQIPVGIV